MGGLGSGRPSGSGRGTAEGCRSIDVNRLHREGCLRPGWSGGWQWTREGEKVASINLRTEYDLLHLSYRWRIRDSAWEDVAETVRIVRVDCRFGGARPYFICPGIVNGIACSRRVGVWWIRALHNRCRPALRIELRVRLERDAHDALLTRREVQRARRNRYAVAARPSHLPRLAPTARAGCIDVPVFEQD